MSKPAEVEALFKETAAAFKDPVSILVNNAGITKDGMLCLFVCLSVLSFSHACMHPSLLPSAPLSLSVPSQNSQRSFPSLPSLPPFLLSLPPFLQVWS